MAKGYVAIKREDLGDFVQILDEVANPRMVYDADEKKMYQNTIQHMRECGASVLQKITSKLK